MMIWNKGKRKTVNMHENDKQKLNVVIKYFFCVGVGKT